MSGRLISAMLVGVGLVASQRSLSTDATIGLGAIFLVLVTAYLLSNSTSQRERNKRSRRSKRTQ